MAKVPGYGRDRQEYRPYAIGRDEFGLTARQREVFDLVLDGRSKAEMGEALAMSRQRVNTLVADLVKMNLVAQPEKRGGPPVLTPIGRAVKVTIQGREE